VVVVADAEAPERVRRLAVELELPRQMVRLPQARVVVDVVVQVVAAQPTNRLHDLPTEP
jgi:hypothetical protein